MPFGNLHGNTLCWKTDHTFGMQLGFTPSTRGNSLGMSCCCSGELRGKVPANGANKDGIFPVKTEVFSRQELWANPEFLGTIPLKLHQLLVGAWATPLKNDGRIVSWDYDIPNIWKVIKFMFQTTNQAWFLVSPFRFLEWSSKQLRIAKPALTQKSWPLLHTKTPNINECINHPADWDCFWLLEPRSMWQAQSATAHHQTGRLRRLRLPPKPTRRLMPESQIMEIKGDLRWKTCLQIPISDLDLQNGDFSFWVLSWINTHAHRERACIVNAPWHQLGIPKSSSSGRSSHPHTARSGGGSGGDICLGIHSRNSECTPGLSQPPAGCFKVQPGGNANQQKWDSWTTRGSKICSPMGKTH